MKTNFAGIRRPLFLLTLLVVMVGCRRAYNSVTPETIEVEHTIGRIVTADGQQTFVVHLFDGTSTKHRELSTTNELMQSIVSLLQNRANFRKLDLGIHKVAGEFTIVIDTDNGSLAIEFFKEWQCMDIVDGGTYRLPNDLYSEIKAKFIAEHEGASQ